MKRLLPKNMTHIKGYADGTGNVVNAEIQLEDGGNIELELYPDIAPKRLQILLNLQMKNSITDLCSTEL